MELVAADNNLLIMLMYFWNSLIREINIKSEATKKQEAIERDIGNIVECIDDVRKYLPFAHAFVGCDTTSAVHGLGKLSILKVLKNSKTARRKADVFLQ